MFRSASPPAGGVIKLTDVQGSYGADVSTDENNTDVMFVAESKADALQCLVGPLSDGSYPGMRLSPGISVPVPGRDENGGLKALWVSSAASGQWAISQAF